MKLIRKEKFLPSYVVASGERETAGQKEEEGEDKGRSEDVKERERERDRLGGGAERNIKKAQRVGGNTHTPSSKTCFLIILVFFLIASTHLRGAILKAFLLFSDF